MKSPDIHPLRYHPDSSVLFENIQHLPHAAWLDSGRPASQYGRFDILTAAPIKTISYHPDKQQNGQGKTLVTVTATATGDQQFIDKKPFTVLKTELHQLGFPDFQHSDNIPFIGGALGFFSYDFGRTLESLPSIAKNNYHTPDMLVGLYDWALIQDHQLQTCQLITLPSIDANQKENLISLLNSPQLPNTDLCPSNLNTPFKLNSLFTSNMSKREYSDKFKKIQNYIVAGDVYQVNFAQRYSADFEGSPLSAYRQLRERLPSPFSAYFDIGNDQTILSFSPEKFITVDENKNVETKPIKGTRPRSDNPKEDAQLAKALINCEKDRAENLMIVDLQRNDIGKTCKPGSINVPLMFNLESYPNVHHLVSTITGKLSDQYSAIDLLAGCFPGGSITGAPKLRAMEIIEEVEPHRRATYCGSIGYISLDGQMNTNIAIRTLLCESGKIYCWGGGGIVADSNVDAEYQETLDKIAIIIDTLEESFCR